MTRFVSRGRGDRADKDSVESAHLVNEANNLRAQAEIFSRQAVCLLGAARHLGHEAAANLLQLFSQLLERPLSPLPGSLQSSLDMRVHVLEQILEDAAHCLLPRGRMVGL